MDSTDRKNIWIGIIIFLVVIVAGVGLSYSFGWIGVHQTKTIKKAQKDADREVFEHTQSYVEGKRQEANKMYREYMKADSDTEREALLNLNAHSFSNLSEEDIETIFQNDEKLLEFVRLCKYGDGDLSTKKDKETFENK